MAATISGTTGGIGLIGSATAQNSTSGTSIDFTGIPAGVKRVTVMFNGVSTNGTSIPQIQIGAGGVETTGYSSTASFAATGNQTQYLTSGFAISTGGVQTASAFLSGAVTLTLVGGNTWVGSGNISSGAVAVSMACAGSKTASGTLDRVRITTVNGTDAFDAGTINILYE
jgi:hypothetical protein